jgi:hypothetical protein
MLLLHANFAVNLQTANKYFLMSHNTVSITHLAHSGLRQKTRDHVDCIAVLERKTISFLLFRLIHTFTIIHTIVSLNKKAIIYSNKAKHGNINIGMNGKA